MIETILTDEGNILCVLSVLCKILDVGPQDLGFVDDGEHGAYGKKGTA
jgi:hypothetical protein